LRSLVRLEPMRNPESLLEYWWAQTWFGRLMEP
jgi:hypothetical protein